ncbi:MAG: hypothetical protein AB7N80_02415 [Bdellovibrionales bacterium]
MRLFTLSAILFTILATGCASKRRPPPQHEAPLPTLTDSEVVESIDLFGLSRSLGMMRAIHELGYGEKTFNTCRAGYGYSSTHRCRQQHFVVINFRLQCRDSEGTVSEVTNEELMPVTSNLVRWNLGAQQGYTTTDGDGFGQILMVAPKSSRQQRLRLTVANDFLLMQAGQMKRVVVPRMWCP